MIDIKNYDYLKAAVCSFGIISWALAKVISIHCPKKLGTDSQELNSPSTEILKDVLNFELKLVTYL